MLRTYRMHGAGRLRARSSPARTNWPTRSPTTTASPGSTRSFFVDWLIHNIDVCCWAKNAWPVAAQGMGGRAARTEPDQMFDHYMVEYSFADGTRLLRPGPAHQQVLRHLLRLRPRHQGLGGHHGEPGRAQAAALQEPRADPRERDLALQRPDARSLPGRARPALRRHPQRQALQRSRTLRPGRAWSPSWAAWPANRAR